MYKKGKNYVDKSHTICKLCIRFLQEEEEEEENR